MSLRQIVRRHGYPYALVAPVLIVVALIVAYPLAQGVFFSITNINESTIANPVLDRPASYDVIGLANYLNVLSGDPRYGSFYATLLRTVVWTVGSVAFQYLVGLALALLLNRQVRFRAGYRVLLIMPWAVPAFISAFAWRYLFNADYGLVNAGLGGVGLPEPIWLGQSDLALLSVIVVNIWLGVPFCMLALLGGLQAIPADLYEAARMDGASPWQQFKHITMPGLRPVSGTVILLGVIWTANVFTVIYLITGTNNPNTRILVTYAFERFFTGATRDYAVVSTYGILILLLLLAFALGYRRLLRRQGEVF